MNSTLSLCLCLRCDSLRSLLTNHVPQFGSQVVVILGPVDGFVQYQLDLTVGLQEGAQTRAINQRQTKGELGGSGNQVTY